MGVAEGADPRPARDAPHDGRPVGQRGHRLLRPAAHRRTRHRADPRPQGARALRWSRQHRAGHGALVLVRRLTRRGGPQRRHSRRDV